MLQNAQRQGVTLIEIMIVIAVIVIIMALAVPTLNTTERDLPIKSGADTIRARLAEARGLAIENGQTMRFSISPDGKRVRFAPDTTDFATSFGDDNLGEELTLPKNVTARVVNDDAGEATVDVNGWTRVATFQPDGTCRETVVEIELNQPNTYALIIRLRGLTGNTQTVKRSRSAGP